MSGDEGDHCFTEGVIVVTGRGVPCIGEFDELRMRHLGEKVLDALGADDIGELASDKQNRDPKIDCRLFESLHFDKGVLAG